MPFIHTITNHQVSEQEAQKLKEAFGRAIECIPGKSERWLMLALSDGCRMAFRGKADTPLAMLEVSIFGTATEAALADLTQALTATVTEVLHIPPHGTYVKYTFTDHWGYDGENF